MRTQVATLPPASSPENPPGIAVGTTFDRYTVVRKVGEGGMGQVYAAYDPLTERLVALKIIQPGFLVDASTRSHLHARFLREARALARLAHPNIVPVFDVGVATVVPSLSPEPTSHEPSSHESSSRDATPWMTMEWIEGQTLDGWLREHGKHAKVRDILALWLQAGEGLCAAHQAGIIHRDIKPQNVLVGRDHAVRVVDFGLSGSESTDALRTSNMVNPIGASHASGDAQLTVMGIAVGTPRYMSPEQHKGDPLDARSDQFTFCLCVFEAVYGAPLQACTPYLSVAAAYVAGAWPFALPEPVRQIPPWLTRILVRGLSAEPDKRYPTLRDLLDEIYQGLQRQATTPQRLFLVALLGVFLATTVASHQLNAETVSDHCTLAPDKWIGVWDERVQLSLGEKLMVSEPQRAGQTWSYVSEQFEAYRNQWLDAYADLCRRRADASSKNRHYDQQVRCLDRLLLHVRGLTETWLAGSRFSTQQAMQGVASLPNSETCGEIKVNQLEQQLDVRPEAENLRNELAKIVGEAAAGNHQTAAKLEQLNEAATMLQDFAALAEIWYQYGFVKVHEAKIDDAIAAFIRALYMATASGDASKLATVAAQRIFVELYLGGRSENTSEIIGFAQAALVSDNDSIRVRESMYNALGAVSIAQNRIEDAVAYLNLSLNLGQQLADPYIARSALGNLGVAEYLRNQFASAIEYEQRALRVTESQHGPHHWESILAYSNMALYHHELGLYQAGATNARLAVELAERYSPGYSIALLRDKLWLGMNLVGLGRYREAMALLLDIEQTQLYFQNRGHPIADWATVYLGWLHLARGDLKAAHDAASRGLKQTIDDPDTPDYMRAFAYRLVAEVHLARQDLPMARQMLATGKQYLTVFVGRSARESIAYQRTEAQLELALGHAERAQELAQAAVDREIAMLGSESAQASPYLLVLSQILRANQRFALAQTKVEQALQWLEPAVGSCSHLAVPYWLEHARILLAQEKFQVALHSLAHAETCGDPEEVAPSYFHNQEREIQDLRKMAKEQRERWIAADIDR